MLPNIVGEFEEFMPDLEPSPNGKVAPEPALVALDASYLTTDTANAERFAKHCHKRAIFVPEFGWLNYDGRRWQYDIGKIAVSRLAGETARNIYTEAAAAPDDKLAKTLARHADRSLSHHGREAMIALGAAEPSITASPTQLDIDPWSFNCLNGTLDLRTGKLRPHSPDDFITKLSPVEYDPAATAEQWDNFLTTVMAGNAEQMKFLQKAAGYSLTGLTVEQIWLLMYGGGSNGKSTYLELLRAVLGDYAQQADPSAFLEKRTGGPSNDIARLRGARFVSAVEVGEGRHMAETLVKQLTGGDTMAARFLHKEFFEFKPLFKLWIGSNHKPVIRGTDHAIWRRTRLIPFTVTIPEEQRDRHLAEKLRAELPGILVWAVRGCLAWQKEGLEAPATVKAATAAYRAEMDALATFFEECCVRQPSATSRASELYAAYKTWADQSGEQVHSQRRLGLSLGERGFEKESTRNGVVWHGIGLLTSQER